MTKTTNILNVVCPKCQAVNRVPDARIADSPVCGHCSTALIPATPIELNEHSFAKFIARTSLPIIVDFWAPWCQPCRMMAPEFAAAARALGTAVVLAKLNTEEASSVANQFQIQGIPCLIAFRNGREVARKSGLMRAQQIEQWAQTF